MYSLETLAHRIGARLGRPQDGQVWITGVASWQEAGPGQITLALKENIARRVAAGRAAAVVTRAELVQYLSGKPVLLSDQPRLAFGRLLALFSRRPVPSGGLHPTAWVAPSARLGKGVCLGPYAVVDEQAQLGDRVVVGAGAYVGIGVQVGEETVLGPHVVLYDGVVLGRRVLVQAGAVIGSDGFGYERTPDGFYHLPHMGTVVLEDEVEVGANSTIDRAMVGTTRIGRGTKIDNLVQVAHNVQIGSECLLAGLAGVAGSAVLEPRVTLAGQAGVADHAHIGAGTTVAARGLAAGTVPGGLLVSGVPAREHRQELRVLAATQRLPELLARVRALEQQVQALTAARQPFGQPEGGSDPIAR
ncbi:MAG: UDP-3-O-(3-hydroxymyristoyl)glucosamine N-acyltransferase [Limnochordaceae bacterium]|nr:UDP-3-O-(3-hydroxymyristoyl)glucosamine N-acyltransferase [Limnochordaceae bacterium]